MKDNDGTQWDLKPLSEVADVVYGTRVVKKHDQGTKYPVYGGGGATFSVDQTNRSDCMIVARFGMSEECVRFVGGDFFLNDSGLTVESRDQTDLAQEFLDVQLLGRQAEIYALGRGTAQKNLDVSALKNLPIAIPPLEEQQRIVAVLDETFEGLARARAHAEANLQNARELFAAELFQVFENELPATSDKTFEEITSESLIGLVRSKKEQGLDRQYDYVKMQNIGNDDRYLGAVVDRVDCSPSEEARFRLERGDLLFNTRNSRELVGKSCVIEQDFDRPTVFNNNIMRVRFFSEIYPRYVALAFRSGPVKEQLEAMKSGTTSVVAIYHKSLKKLRLPVPEYAKQRTLVERFDELDGAVQRVIQSYEMQIKDIDDLRQSLLQKAFAGELT